MCNIDDESRKAGRRERSARCGEPIAMPIGGEYADTIPQGGYV